jgi:hypothetical protein
LEQREDSISRLQSCALKGVFWRAHDFKNGRELPNHNAFGVFVPYQRQHQAAGKAPLDIECLTLLNDAEPGTTTFSKATSIL